VPAFDLLPDYQVKPPIAVALHFYAVLNPVAPDFVAQAVFFDFLQHRNLVNLL